jgi:hypothetical protein
VVFVFLQAVMHYSPHICYISNSHNMQAGAANSLTKLTFSKHIPRPVTPCKGLGS